MLLLYDDLRNGQCARLGQNRRKTFGGEILELVNEQVKIPIMLFKLAQE